MQAKYLQPGDVVLFSNGESERVYLKMRPNDDFFRVYVMYGSFSTIYQSDDELLVARNGQVE